MWWNYLSSYIMHSPIIQRIRRALRNRRFSFLLSMLMAFQVSFTLASSSSTIHKDELSKGSSLSVDNPGDILRSPNGVFCAGFHSVGNNAYAFAVWFNNQLCLKDCIVWMANRDEPVNGKQSKLILDKYGNLFLTDAGYRVIWSVEVALNLSAPSVQLQLLDSGNLILYHTGTSHGNTVALWQSFDYPTDTLLPEQKFTRYTTLVSSRARGNVSSSYYKLYFDNDNVLRLLYDGPDISSVYWPHPYNLPWDSGRNTYNDSRVALLNSVGMFESSDFWNFNSSDYGVNIWRRLTMDTDGNLRLYSLLRNREWAVSWQAITTPCDVHGICGPNAVCQYDTSLGRSCICLPGYERKNPSDWSEGCKPLFNSFCNLADANVSDFLHVPHRDFFGYDEDYHKNVTLDQCKRYCLDRCSCKGFQFRFKTRECYLKALILNGRFSLESLENMYLRLPKDMLSSYQTQQSPSSLNCSYNPQDIQLHRAYLRSHKNKLLVKILKIVAGVIAGLEALGVLLVWLYITTKSRRKDEATSGVYQLAAIGFRRFSYSELKKATRNFSQEIGRGAAGTVYKAILPSGQVAAVKQLNEASLQGEDEFLAEVSMIGKLNHMNLIEMLGYCAEGKHWLLVYEYMTHGSLADNLSKRAFNWNKMFDIAIGAARGLTYLHEECLEWVLHCDVKPQNILLDSNYQPKVSDFGLSKLLNRRDDKKHLGFSKIRGTRGYMAPEWVYNLEITAKVDVYSYGMVVLQMVTGRNPGVGVPDVDSGGQTENRSLASWIRGEMNGDVPTATWIEEVVDHTIEGELDIKKVEVLVAVGLQCIADDKDERPTMRQVVEMLEH
ncbi:hypothetical protein SAY86_029367 [Trapa natans]|uniref:Receptor-like serine/threonine-protein kinase n=1 Tax=Trapa natans TaxID=22666 RepID=A0AAN7RFY6_TRANT|nr:hypothetical protein SAY86_029367 [Trapa natans]